MGGAGCNADLAAFLAEFQCGSSSPHWEVMSLHSPQKLSLPEALLLVTELPVSRSLVPQGTGGLAFTLAHTHMCVQAPTSLSSVSLLQPGHLNILLKSSFLCPLLQTFLGPRELVRDQPERHTGYVWVLDDSFPISEIRTKPTPAQKTGWESYGLVPVSTSSCGDQNPHLLIGFSKQAFFV